MPKTLDRVDIVASFDDNYAQHAAVMLISVLKQTSRLVAFHFLISDVAPRNVARLQRLALSNGSKVKFYKLDERQFGDVVLGNLVVQAYFRLMIPSLFSDFSRILYLDVDVVVKGDVGELFDVDLEDQRIAAVADPGVNAEFISRISRDGRTYFNSGVVVMAVNEMSSSESSEWLAFASKRHDLITFHDQCVMNHFLGFKKLSPRFNLMSQFFLPYDDLLNKEYMEEEVLLAKKNPLVIHFNTYFGKPWESHCTHPLKRAYLYGLLLTPWRWNIFGIVVGQLKFRIRNL